MCPEYGATAAYFPVDDKTLDYLKATGRSEEQIALVENTYKAQGMFRTESSEKPVFTAELHLDLGTVEPSLAGPKASSGPDSVKGNETKGYLLGKDSC
jgi:aconitate hydratase